MYNGRVELEGFVEAVSNLGIALSDKQLSLFMTYKEMLQEASKLINLTTITEDGAILEKHFLDSLLSVKYCSYEGSLCDVGSGAGFPGIPLKIAFPNLEATLLEPTKKKCRFLEELIDVLGLTAIEVVAERAEDYAKKKRESYDIVTARGVKNLNILSELCVPLIKVGGKFVALKGSKGQDEFTSAETALKKLGIGPVEIHEDKLPSGDRRLIAIGTKTEKTKVRYPRHYSDITKRPL